MADHVLAPEKMPEALLAYISHGYVAASAEIEATSPNGQATLEVEVQPVPGEQVSDNNVATYDVTFQN